jgi:putative flavoprotein involved in K+ transport
MDTIVIGAGQAGLSASHLLTLRGREHLVLEAGDVAETWRSRRWDGFYLNTPNWTLQLPGHEYDGDEPDAFLPRAAVVEYLEAYANGAPVRTDARVTALRREGDRWRVELEDEVLHATNVVVATGAFGRPFRPDVGAAPAGVLELNGNEYRSPEALPDGAVLVVGSGQTGCQIAEELLQAGRDVYLAVGRCPWFPRRHRGRDMLHWAIEVGLMDETVDKLPSPAARLACNPAISGNDGGHDCHARWLGARGVVLAGRVERIDGTRVTFGPGLDESLAQADAFAATVKRRIDEHLGVEPEPPEEPAPYRSVDELDLDGVGAILWTTGFRPDFDWIEGVALDEQRFPVQQRGVAPQPGLYFLGVNWLHKRKSALFLGVGEDAEHVVADILGR